MGEMPKNPAILLSYVNTQLRDFYASLTEMCAAHGVAEEQIVSILEQIDYRYDVKNNQFL